MVVNYVEGEDVLPSKNGVLRRIRKRLGSMPLYLTI